VVGSSDVWESTNGAGGGGDCGERLRSGRNLEFIYIILTITNKSLKELLFLCNNINQF